MSYGQVADHRAMALDGVRNRAYGDALRAVVGPQTVVLDLGAGTGIHGLMAARLGARRVYLVEPEDVVVVAEQIARANGLEHVVSCVHGRIEDAVLLEQVDVLVSALTGNFLLTEDLLPTLFDARDAWLKPAGTLIPDAARMEVVPVSAPDLHAREIAAWSTPQEGVDLAAARSYAANTLYYRPDAVREAVWLADPASLATIDFRLAREAAVHARVTHVVDRSAVCHGWIGWFTMRLGERWLSASPREPRLHWTPAFLPVDPPIAVERGEPMTFALDRAPDGDWTWRVETGSTRQQHSTLLSAAISPRTLERTSLVSTPSASEEGQATAWVLSHLDGTRTVEAVARALAARHPDRYGTAAAAVSFVQRLVRRHAGT